MFDVISPSQLVCLNYIIVMERVQCKVQFFSSPFHRCGSLAVEMFRSSALETLSQCKSSHWAAADSAPRRCNQL